MLVGWLGVGQMSGPRRRAKRQDTRTPFTSGQPLPACSLSIFFYACSLAADEFVRHRCDQDKSQTHPKPVLYKNKANYTTAVPVAAEKVFIKE